MTTTPFIVTPESRANPLDVVGERVTVLAGAHATSGYEIFFQNGTEGSGPPPHSHAWDESFFVLEGSVIFGHGDEQHEVATGSLVHVPGGTVHWFRFGPGGARMVSITGQGSRAAEMFADISREVPPGPPDVGKLRSIADRHGCTLDLG